jgi:DNA-binding NarL/FixJ family response regulator
MRRFAALLRVRLPEASAVVFSDRDDVDEVNRALTHGVRGYIPISVACDVSRRSTNGSRRGSTQATSKLRNR